MKKRGIWRSVTSRVVEVRIPPLHHSTKNVKVVEGESFNVENLILDVKSFIAGVFNIRKVFLE